MNRCIFLLPFLVLSACEREANVHLAVALPSVAILALVVLGWYGFEGIWNRRLFRKEPGRVCMNLRPHEAKTFLAAHPDTQIVDVRSTEEFESGALPGAVHFPISDSKFVEKIEALDRDRPVLVYCAGGFRSRKATAVMKELTFENIQHLHRGYHSWKLAGFPVTLPAKGGRR